MKWWLWLIVGYFGINLIIMVLTFLVVRGFDLWAFLKGMAFALPLLLYGLLRSNK